MTDTLLSFLLGGYFVPAALFALSGAHYLASKPRAGPRWTAMIACIIGGLAWPRVLTLYSARPAPEAAE